MMFLLCTERNLSFSYNYGFFLHLSLFSFCTTLFKTKNIIYMVSRVTSCILLVQNLQQKKGKQIQLEYIINTKMLGSKNNIN